MRNVIHRQPSGDYRELAIVLHSLLRMAAKSATAFAVAFSIALGACAGLHASKAVFMPSKISQVFANKELQKAAYAMKTKNENKIRKISRAGADVASVGYAACTAFFFRKECSVCR